MLKYLEDNRKNNENRMDLQEFIEKLPTVDTMKNIEFKGLLNIDKTLFIYNYCYLGMEIEKRKTFMKKVLIESEGDKLSDILITLKKDVKRIDIMTLEMFFWYVFNYIKDNFEVNTLSKDFEWYMGILSQDWEEEKVYTRQELELFLNDLFFFIHFVFSSVQKSKNKLLFNNCIIDKIEFNKIYNKYKEIIINR